MDRILDEINSRTKIVEDKLKSYQEKQTVEKLKEFVVKSIEFDNAIQAIDLMRKVKAINPKFMRDSITKLELYSKWKEFFHKYAEYLLDKKK